MTSVVDGGRGSPKSRRKEKNQLICDSDKGEGVKKSENFADVIYGSPLSELAHIAMQISTYKFIDISQNPSADITFTLKLSFKVAYILYPDSTFPDIWVFPMVDLFSKGGKGPESRERERERVRRSGNAKSSLGTASLNQI